MCVKLNLETYSGIENSQIEGHKSYMGLKSNCRGLNEKYKFKWMYQSEANNVDLKIKTIESPYK